MNIPAPLLWQLPALAGLLVLSGLFSMSETAFTSTDRVQVRGLAEAGNRRARRLEKLLEHPERILTTVLVGNNIVNIGASVLAGNAAAALLGPTAGPVVAIAVMTFLVLVFSEITPKTVAVRHAQGVALVLTPIMAFVQVLLAPIVAIFTAAARMILALFGVHASGESPLLVTQAQIENLVRVGAAEGEVERFEEKVITEVFDFTESQVHRLMTPATDVHFLDKSATLHQALLLAAQTGHSRIPIVDGDFDHVLGFVHAKDLLRFNDAELQTEPVTDAVRAVLITGSATPPDKVLARMQRERKLMAIVQDDDGRSVGIATVEDLLEELVGEIHDEFDTEPLRPSEQVGHRVAGGGTAADAGRNGGPTP